MLNRSAAFVYRSNGIVLKTFNNYSPLRIFFRGLVILFCFLYYEFRKTLRFAMNVNISVFNFDINGKLNFFQIFYHKTTSIPHNLLGKIKFFITFAYCYFFLSAAKLHKCPFSWPCRGFELHLS